MNMAPDTCSEERVRMGHQMSPSQKLSVGGDRVGLCPHALRNGAGIKKVLVQAGYTQRALADTVGVSSLDQRQDAEVTYRRVREDSPYNVLAQLFWLGRAVSEPTLLKLVPGLNSDELVAAGLLRRHDGTIRSTAKLGPYNELLLASDFGPELGGALHADHVLGVGAASVTLAGMTVRRKVARALDLGSGAGIQAFLAASHADLVVGTDVSARALAFAEFNARLNGITNVQWRAGSLYEPVRSETFDLIVSNPPFVISPESSFTFRDSGLPADIVSQQVVQGAGVRLANGGFACILFNWYHQDGSDWAARPAEWAADAGCDALLICFKSTDPLTYASEWLRSSLGPDCPDYGRRLDQWGAYYEQTGAGQISGGVMILRRRMAPSHWFSARRLGSTRCVGPCGGQIERMVAAEDLLAGIRSDQELLQCRLQLSDDHTLRHELKISDGRWMLDKQTLHTQTGMLFSGDLDVVTAELLARCDGRNTLGEAITATAKSMRLEADKLQPACLTAVRKLLQSGLLYSCEAHHSRADDCG
jgi:methylase of polypeptide subunit release factors